ncbi:unnamed protein product, partial [Ceratitis capitata]
VVVYDDDATYMAEIDWGKFSQNVCDLMQWIWYLYALQQAGNFDHINKMQSLTLIITRGTSISPKNVALDLANPRSTYAQTILLPDELDLGVSRAKFRAECMVF